MQRDGNLHSLLLDKLAVYSETDTRAGLERLDVNIRRVYSERGLYHRVYQPNDRRVVDTLAGLCIHLVLLGCGRRLVVQLVHNLVNGLLRVEPADSLLDLGLGGYLRDYLHAGLNLQLLEYVEVDRVVGSHHKAVVVHIERYDRLFPGCSLRDFHYRVLVYLH